MDPQALLPQVLFVFGVGFFAANLKVVAEGVGTQAQLDFLKARDCDAFQGFWVSEPLAVAAFESFCRERADQGPTTG